MQIDVIWQLPGVDEGRRRQYLRTHPVAIVARMTAQSPFELRLVGRVESSLTDPASAPKQGTEGAPEASIVLDPDVVGAMRDIEPGDRLIVLTWLHLADRNTLRVHPRDDARQPLRGVFSTRSADRPNPIGLHVVRVVAVDGGRLRVRDL